jgi:broad specificity phosphatase PhoE
MDLTTPQGVTRLILVRHAEPADDPAGRRHGRVDCGLSKHGMGQAEELGRWLRAAPIDRIVSSVRACARETAAPLARALGVPVKEVKGLEPQRLGELDGMSFEDAARRFPELHARWLKAPTEVDFPGGEPFAAVRERVQGAVAALRAEGPWRTMAIVSHAVVNRILLADALRLSDLDALRLDQSFCAVNMVDLAGDAPVVRLVNAVP